MSRTRVQIISGIFIVVVSFAVTTYVLDWWTGPPSSGSLTATAALKGQNLLWPSQDLANPRWVRVGIAAIEPNATKSPNGQNSAFRLIESNDNGRHFITISIDSAAPGKISTSSVYFKPDDRNIRLETADIPKGKYGLAICNLTGNSAGSISKSGDIVGGAVESVGGGWYRCWTTMPYDLSTAVLNIELLSKDGIAGYQGDGHSGVLLSSPQFETGDKPTTYVPTSTGPIANVN
jgi:hypothetical protein